MPLTRNAFSVISSLIDKKCSSQRQIAEAAGLSLGLVNETYKSLLELGFVKDYIVTDLGEEALLPYKANNAIILAAGLSTRFVPISYDRPKGTLRVRGEVLIEPSNQAAERGRGRQYPNGRRVQEGRILLS